MYLKLKFINLQNIFKIIKVHIKINNIKKLDFKK